MKCSDLDELLSAYANGELPRTQREFIEEHLSICADCRAALADYTEVRQQLMSLKAAPSMPDLNEATMSRIRAAKYAPLKEIERKGVGSFFPRRPNWKVGLISLLVIAIVISLAVAIPLLFGQDDTALAADIALNSTQIQAALGSNDIQKLEVLDIVYDDNSDIATVVLQLEYNLLIAADVDMKTEQVIETHLLELTDEKKQEIIDMVKADSRVQDLLEQGAYIYDFVMGYYPDAPTWGINPSGVFLIPYQDSNTEVSTKFLLILRMALENTEYWVAVDPILGNVFDVVNKTEAEKQVEENMIIMITITSGDGTTTVITK